MNINSKESKMKKKIDDFSNIIKELYIPIEQKDVEMKLVLEKYSNAIENSVKQVVGTQTIEIPANLNYENNEDKETSVGRAEEYRKYLEQWTITIKSVITKELNKKPDGKFSLSIIHYWRGRSTILNMLFQELSKPEVNFLIKKIEKCNDENFVFIANNSIKKFEEIMKDLTKYNGEAKDNVKFLNTLERQFKNLQSNDFNTIGKTLPSLLNGIKLVYIISRHFKTDERISSLLITISNEICNKVESILNIKRIFQYNDEISESYLEETEKAIIQGKNILYNWKTKFENIKEKLEEEGGDRWDFDQKPIKERPEYMIKVLDNLKEIVEKLKKFMVLLGPKLKAVTGNIENIDELLDSVKNLNQDFLKLDINIYDKQNQDIFKKKLKDYNLKTEEIQNKTINLIQTTFSDLRSSESAFDLLQKFINLRSLDIISKKLEDKYKNVLKTYRRELNHNKEIFERDCENKTFSKKKPPIAGAISWKRLIFQRVKNPIIKFIKKTEWDEEDLKEAKEEYKKFAKKLDQFEKDKLEEWSKNINERAICFLKENILKCLGKNNYVVNFSKDFKVLINEAKHLDQMGHPLPKTILNIALQEKEYYKSVDKLQKMLLKYNNTVNSLTDIEKSLFKVYLKGLDESLNPVINSFNLNSLGINEFIISYKDELKKFNEIKNKVDEKKRMIEDIISKIENTKLIEDREVKKIFGNKEYMSLSKFYSTLENEISKTSELLAEKYKKIGDTMLTQIEFVIYKKNTGKNPHMKIYYSYWERRIYNALVKMIMRGLLTFKALIKRPASNPHSLFKVSTEFHYMKVITIPHQNEIRVTLNNLIKNIKETTLKFLRWKEGTCIVYDKGKDFSGNDDLLNYSFLRDINENQTIKLISVELSELKKHAFARLEKYKSVWEENKGEYHDMYSNFKNIIWDQKNKFKIDKILEKNPTTENFEFFLDYFYGFLEEFKSQKNEINAGFIRVDFLNVKEAYISQCKDSLSRIGKAFLKISEKQTEEIYKIIMNYNNLIDQEADTLKELKDYLNILTEIKNSTMDIEFQIMDVEEKYRILLKYDLSINEENYDKMKNLTNFWEKLLVRTKLMDESLKEKKLTFANQTKVQVEELKEEIDLMHEDYFKVGPTSKNINLKDGYRKLLKYKNQIDRFNKLKSDLVLSEKLFNLDISLFPKLVEVEKDFKLIQPIYDLYHEVVTQIDEWSKMNWAKLDYNILETGKNEFLYKLKVFKTPKVELLEKLRKIIENFTKMTPLIGKLKANSNFKEGHWERLMTNIGVDIGSINLKFLTLQQVFDLNLQKNSEKVDEIVLMAAQESTNEEQIRQIEVFWKNTSFDVIDYRKGNEKKGYVIKVIEEITLNLNDHLITLQNMDGSKYAIFLRGNIREWVDNLNKIQETIDIWLQVQRKWMYLEIIFIGNEDIRQQLPKEAKNFESYHKTFKKINEQAEKNGNIYSNCIQIESNLPQLKTLAKNFDKSQKSLSNYLNSKKMCFPRFYFISDDDLLSILGSSNINAVTTHLMKLFDNCKNFKLENEKNIMGMISDEGESYDFREIIKPEGAVETWMNLVNDEMKKTLKTITKEGIFYYGKMESKKWIKKYLGMVILCGSKIWWTWRVEDVFRKVKEGDKYAMKKESQKQTSQLNELVDMVRSNLELIDNKGIIRKKINTLIIIEVHQRDIVDRFVRDSILDEREFDWESQLRFYWNPKLNDIEIKQCTGVFNYGYEYQGLNGRLVITPLTDRCVMTLTTALSFHLGGAPAGPAGTGKTETCKDLAKSLARRCVVTNCGENFDSLAMGNNFSGLCQTGFWGCFDEFNRIKPDVLSVVSAQIKTIQHALIQKKKIVNLLSRDIGIVSTVGIFVTMNPGYEGRSELPDNLKALFRPIVMVVPDKNIICENMLMSEGFIQARILAKKMTVLYKLSEEQLSKQYHYDFGLRALKSVLVMAGALKRGSSDVSEEKVMMRALRDMNMPKFVDDDVVLFMGLINDLFPNLEIESVTHKNLRTKIIKNLKKLNYSIVEDQVSKVIQLQETMQTRHATMVVGPTGSGKTTIIEQLKEALPNKVKIFTINPKAQNLLELYGEMDSQTRDWTDGVLSHIFKLANEELSEGTMVDKFKKEVRWILFDGDVDSIWVENMNSVMDDSKVLTLSNGDRIRLKNYCNLLFEVFDLQYASPATISRCGMVYVDANNLDYSHYYMKWITKFKDQTLESEEQVDEYLKELFLKFIPPLIDFIFEGKLPSKEISTPLSMIIPKIPINMVKQLTKLLDFYIPQDFLIFDNNKLERLFVFCIVWSLGAVIKLKDRKRFNKIIIDELSSVILPSSLYESYFDTEEFSFSLWDNIMKEYVPPKDGAFSKILVPTTDTVKYTYLLKAFIDNKSPILFLGDQGTAKTVIVKNYLDSLNLENNLILNMNFSFRTNSLEIQNNIEMLCDKRRPGLYGPKGNKNLIVFIDEMHMPKKDAYGTQQPIALLRFLIDKGIMFERGGQLEKRNFKDINFCGIFLPPGAGYNSLDPRFMSLFSTISIINPSQENIERIYNSIFMKQITTFNTDIKELAQKITTATIKLYMAIEEKLPRTPLKFHYIFNLRDLSKIYQGLSKANLQYFSKKENFLRLWKNECTRVFCDRLISKEDKNTVEDLMKKITTDYFGKENTEILSKKPLIMCDFMLSDPLYPETEDPRFYREVETYDELKEKITNLLDQYNSENTGKEMDLVLFKDALDHLVRLKRIISFPKGHALLIGYGGSGKKSLTKLSTFIAGYELFQISLKRNYKEVHFRENLETLYTKILIEDKQVVFMFSDSQITEESFLELINTILTVGIINNLFDDAKRNDIRNNLRDKCKKEGKGESPEEIWEFYENSVRKNLHMVLCMSPTGEKLRIRCRNFPGLVSSTNIDWFFAWPKEALNNVAEHYLNDFNLGIPDDINEQILNHFVYVHMDIPIKSELYKKKAGRLNFSTPKNYLDFLHNFKSVYKENFKKTQENIARFTKGLSKLEESAEKIGQLKKLIDQEKIKVEGKKEKVEILLKEIKEKSIIVKEKQKIATEESECLKIENEEIHRTKLETEKILKEKLPALEEARKKVSEINKKELDKIRFLKNPPSLIKKTVTCLQVLKINGSKDGDGWNEALTMLNDYNLIHTLIEYSKDKDKISKVTKTQIKIIDEKLKSIESELKSKNKSMDQVSPACTKLLFWVNAVQILYETNQIIKPLEKQRKKLEKQKAIKEKALNETNEKLSKLTADLNVLNEKKNIREKDLKELKEKVETMKNKLSKAENLITNLTQEKIRWGKEKERLMSKVQYLYGETLLCSSFLSYFGPFDQHFRKIMTKEYASDIKKRGILLDDVFKIENMLTTDVEIAIWNSQSLPNDELSIQNGILTNGANRYPLCIDPQLQALNWILKKEEKNLNKVSFNNESDFGRTLEMCVRFGTPILIENVGEYLDPLIDPILEKNYTIINGVKHIEIGEDKIQFKEDTFNLFMVSKLSNPRYSPEIMGKTSVINYSVTFEGLKEQLISEVVIHEEEEKENLRKKLISDMSDNKKNRELLEKALLTNLVTAKGSLLENDDLIATLEETKNKSKIIEESIIEGVKTSELLEIARQSYKNIAIRGAILFFCMQKMSAISEMYEYSLSSYLNVFRQSLKDAKPENILIHRINSIIDKLTQNMYDYVLLGIFEKHKLMFSFQMTIMIMEKAGTLDKKELDFFLKGNTSLQEMQKKKVVEWIGKSNCKDLYFLNDLSDDWKNLISSIEDNEEEWFNWFSLINPENYSLPKPFDKISKFKILLLLKVFRPDRVIIGIKKFIIEQYRDNEYYVQSPTLNFKKILKQSNETSPILFILSPGADPLHDVQELANLEGYTGNKFKSISLGQNMEKEAEELIINFAQRGYWAMLQNCDLLPDWLTSLEKLLETLPKKITKIHKNFRLWLTTKPTKSFPLGILQKALKVVTEPPEGLKLNMKAIISKLTDEDLKGSEHTAFKSLTYVITYFHAILLDRRKFGKIGFNVCYDFNESDYRISFQLLKLYLEKSLNNKDESVPWDSLKYLIGQAMYGGRVTDDYDRRVLITYLDEYMGDFLFDTNNEFAFAKTEDFNYQLPMYSNVEALNLKINELPIIDVPHVFGLNPNSEITYFTNSSKLIWKNLLAMQLVGENTSSILKNGEHIKKIMDEILEKCPDIFNISKIRAKLKEITPTLVVLLQELDRFNKLILTIKSSLKKLQRALNGEIGMNNDLEELSKCLLNGLLPSKWRKLAPQTQKKLANWIIHFKKRVIQYRKWIKNEKLNVVWLSGLHIPESYLTALVQATCRKKNWALDKSTLFTTITNIKDPETVKNPPEFGCYVSGLFLEGASWDIEKNCVCPQKPKELITELPLMKINPVEINKLKLKDTLKVPVYSTQNRRNAAGFGHVFDSDLRTLDHPSHWILQGISIVMNTD